MSGHLWIVPLIPAVSFPIILFFGTRMPRRGSEIGIAAMISSVILSFWIAIEWITGDGVAKVAETDWFQYGDVEVQVGTIFDGMTAMMLVLVSVVSLLVQTYSTNYMQDDRRYTHYFAILTLFTAGMQWFVMSSTTLQMIFGWEIMSLCSFVLIGHWWEEKRNAHAAMKAFLTTRAGDVGLFVGVAILFFAAGQTFDIGALNEGALSGSIEAGLLLAGASALFIAVIGKSAQFPLHTWLPDAMAGPTPMSALIHAATMVVAGVFLLGRLFPVFAEAFSIAPLADTVHGLNPIALIGGITILIAALLAFVQHDIKKVLAYSTVSQLGFMVMAMGVGAWTAAMFHLFCHAYFKALLFFAAGSVSHVVHGFDIEKDMGGLRKPMPITHATFVVGAAALIGIFPLSGFWSKEQIIAQAGANGYEAFQIIGLIGTFLTAAYMMRCYFLMFWGEHRGSSHPHEAPRALTVPCIILAVLSATVGFLQAPAFGINLFNEWVAPEYLSGVEHEAGILRPFLIELAFTATGIGLAVVGYLKAVGPRTLAERFYGARVFYKLLYNRYYLDWLYERVIVRGIKRLGELVDRRIDRQVVDGIVNEVAAGTDAAGGVLSQVQNGRVQRYAVLMLSGVTIITIILATGKW